MQRIFLLLILFSILLSSNEQVKIGVLAKRSSDITLAEYKATAEYLTQEMNGYEFQIIPISFAEMQENVAQNNIDFLITNTMDYVTLEYLYGVSRIATLKNLNSNKTTTTSFGSAIIVPQTSKIETLVDLKRKAIGAVDANSFGGWIMALKELKDNGVEERHFKSLTFYGSHDQVVFAVRDGMIDAGIVRSDTLERMEREGLINLECCKVVEPKIYKNFSFAVTTKLYPEWPFAKLSTTSEALANEVLVALLKITPESKMATDAGIAGWTIPLDYSGVHDVMQELHVGPYKELAKLSLERFYNKYKFLFYSVIIVFLIVVGVLAYIYKLNKNYMKIKNI
ncbi:MAG: phosphate/phosphite/phosphonate ABC transporter substrate-binding protein [Sulfurimonadaceae bacterium]|jgi:phosphate/phosphite/phosphonate ABC transporter binding protein|nr:phosphate/phosphite/phosphonate ABC transporter substrate-binding protein [Sulfurimonadaceae bacterium]